MVQGIPVQHSWYSNTPCLVNTYEKECADGSEERYPERVPQRHGVACRAIKSLEREI